ncbi:unnamed protein product [Trichobilharzia regenti]|nr:unnamed protein product [Trichobilharzia regenti]
MLLNEHNVTLIIFYYSHLGQESFAGVIDTNYRSGDGFIIVFSLTDMESFKAVDSLLERFLIVRPSACPPRVLVGNKADLTDERQVSPELALRTARQWNIPYMETSAKENVNVQEESNEMTCLVFEASTGITYEMGDIQRTVVSLR